LVLLVSTEAASVEPSAMDASPLGCPGPPVAEAAGGLGGGDGDRPSIGASTVVSGEAPNDPRRLLGLLFPALL
jgi:hypothetical protein